MTQTIDAPPRTASAVPLSGAAAVVVVAAPLLVLASELIAPREPQDLSAGQEIAFLVDHSDRLTASWLVGLLAAAALAAAYVLIASRLAGRGRVVGRVAATLGVLGGAGLAGHMVSSLATLDIALDDRGASAAVTAATEGRAAIATVPLVVLGLNLAVVLLAVTAYRAGLAPVWVIALGVLAFVGDFSPTNYNTVLHATFAAGVFALVAAGLARGRLSER